jgi:hypothetical protein
MTVSKLYNALTFIVTLDDQLHLQSGLESIRDTLNNLVGAPAHPPHQNALASALSEFSKSAAKLATSITPSQAKTIAEMGGQEFFDASIAEKIKSAIAANAMTPTVARDIVQDLATRCGTFLDTVRSTLQGLRRLSFKQATLPAGSADLAFLIPRDLFDNHLGEFAKELTFISRLIQDVTEGVTGQTEAVKLESLSSSIPTITLGASLPAIAILATIVNKFLEAWERIRKIRSLRDELAEMGMKGTAIEELTEDVTTTVDEIVEESTKIVLVSYNGHDPGRKNELRTAVSQDVRRLFGQIERGLTVEFHAEPRKDANEDDRKALDTVAEISRQLEFPSVPSDPLLLGSGEILEGEIRRTVAKKTSTTKTITTKRESKKEKPEQKVQA